MKKIKLAGLLIVSLAMAMRPTPAQAQAPYFQAVTNLNPVGYWPMHENEATVHGDIETNYGTLGTLGTGFYGDWETLGSTPVVHGATPGCIANDASETCVNFSQLIGAASVGGFTNGMYVSHTSPLTTLKPPFSVECWVNGPGGGNDKQADVWSQAGSAGFNGGPNLAGMRLHWGNVGFTIYTYNGVNGGTLITLLSYNSVSANTWYHTVVTDDGTNITLWINGVARASAANAGNFSPDFWSPLAIDNGPGGGAPYRDSFSGRIDQFAVYTNALTQDQITNDYTVGVTASSATNYYNTIISNNPVIYFQMDSPTISAESAGPTLINYGSSAINGTYRPEVVPGGISGPGILGAGFGVNNAMPGNFTSGFADVGNSASYNPTGTSTNFSIVAWFQGGPADSRNQSIVGHGTNSWQLDLTASGTVVFNPGTNSAATVATGSAAGDVVSPGVYNDGFWHQVVATHSSAINVLYLDGVPVATNNSAASIPGSGADVLIGTDPSFTNNPTQGQGRQFSGNICEVAYFAATLSASQVQSLYNTSELAPAITKQPVIGTASAGGAFTNTVVAIGVSPFYYQWFTNSIPIPGATSSNLIINPVQGADAASYYVVVTNIYGSATSAVVSLTVLTAPNFIGQFPITYTNILNTNFMTLYAGADPNFSISAGGAQPIYYFWSTNSVLDGVATNARLTLTNVQIGSFSDYCIISNFLGMATSAVWSATVIAGPTNSAGSPASYPQQVMSLNPIAYWRLNESDDTAGNEGAIAHDYASGNNGLYTNVILGQAGYNSTTDPGGTSMEVGSGSYTINSYVGSIGTNIDVSAPVGSNVEYSIECWANIQANGSGIVAKGRGGGGEEFVLGTVPSGSSLGTKNTYMFYLRQPGFNNFFVADSSIIPNGSGWDHLVGVCDQAHTNLTLYINGQVAASTYVPTNSGVVSDTSPMTIGVRDSSAGSGHDLQSIGTISDVALFNYALSPDQVLNEYLVAGGSPYFVQQPTNVDMIQGSNLVDTAVVGGAMPMSYQWFETNVVTMTGYALPGQTNATLAINNLTTNDIYYLNVTNIYDSTNSVVVSVGIYVGPAFIGQLPVPYTNPFTLFAGARPTFSVSAISLQNGQPVYYQWFTNGVGVGGATSSNVTLSSVVVGMLTNYCVASNLLGASTSIVWTASVIAAPTNPYPQAALSLQPIGYWRLNEPDDGNESSDGNAGVIAHDYAGGNDGIYTNTGLGGYYGFLSPQPPYSALDTNETPAGFGLQFVNCDAYGIVGIDFSSPTNTSEAFTVEAWVNGYQQTLDAGIVTKGYGGGGEQFDLDAGGPTNINQSTAHNFRFLVRDASGTAHSVNSGIQPGNVWHHLVGVCDEANNNLSFYVDGQVVGTAAIAPGSGILTSTWPMSIGSRSSTLPNIRLDIYDNQFVGFVGDVAIYNYALTALQVTNEYQGIFIPGVNSNPTNIAFSVTGSQLTLSWPTDHTGWQLQAQTNSINTGLGTNWVNVGGSTATNQVIIPISATNGSVFYRLIYNP